MGGRGQELALLDVGDVVVAASAAHRPRCRQSPGEEQGRAAATGTAGSWGARMPPGAGGVVHDARG